MSEKNWLIRTPRKKILGPVSKEKIIELLDNGELSDEDEICSGNGYWFWAKEKELIDKYIYGDTPQAFNPLDEGKSVLSEGQG